MAINDGERLRQLVGDYYHGLLSPESYREQRAQLLDNIGAHVDEQSDTITNRKKPSAAEPSEERAFAPGQAASEPTAGLKRPVIIAAAIVGIVVVGFVVATQMPRPEVAREPDEGLESPDARSSLERGDALIEEFLSRNDWSDDSLSNFELAWGALDDRQRQLATEGRRYRVLTNVLHRRIREETALGSAPDGERLDSLTDFASMMGAPYRESLAPVTDEVPQEERVVGVEPSDEAPVPEPPVDDAVTAPVEDLEKQPVPALAETPPAEKDEQAMDEGDQPEEKLVADPEPTVSSDRAAAVDDPCPATIANTRRPYCQDVLANGSKGPALVVLPTGSFVMGNDRIDSEAPSRRIEIAYNIAMSRFEVTADEYSEYCAATSLPCPDAPWSGNHPVVSVSWDDAVAYTEWLSESTTFSYRLPSEAEWEFAARGGTQSAYHFGDEITPSAALSRVNGPVEAPVPRSDRTINRNPFRLNHMSGNVREWTLDSWYPNYEDAGSDGSARLNGTEPSRVVRGGSYSDPGDKLRSAAREPLGRSHRDRMTGFRVVREVVATSR